MRQKLQNFLDSHNYILFKEVTYVYKTFYNKEREEHRLNNPAQEWHDGSKRWFVNGEFHRLDGPAREWNDGSKCWYVNGKRHRLDGPAEEWSNGDKAWYVNGEEIKEENYPKYVKEYLETKA